MSETVIGTVMFEPCRTDMFGSDTVTVPPKACSGFSFELPVFPVMPPPTPNVIKRKPSNDAAKDFDEQIGPFEIEEVQPVSAKTANG